MKKEDMREEIESIVAGYCDMTWDGLKYACFSEIKNPQELADKIIEYIENLVEV